MIFADAWEALGICGLGLSVLFVLFVGRAMMTRRRRCPGCGSRQVRARETGGVKWHQCPDCGDVW